MIQRYINAPILKDLKRKMVFVGGPRQSGKTTLARRILTAYPYKKGRRGLYFNWDNDDDRRQLLNKRWGDEHQLICLDEIHKYKRWKNWLKGLHDKEGDQHRFFVTGSARLDVYKKGGDSLMGRYHYWRLHPFTLTELPPKMSPKEAYKRLISVGGFPEPFLDGDETQARRWRKERFDRVLKDDVRDLESLKDIQTLILFVDQLRTRVGSPTVLSNIATDLEISPKTAKHWLNVLEKMYLLFTVKPLTKNLPRAVKKPPKIYFFDNADVIGDEGAIFENFIATSLLKYTHFMEDYKGFRYDLRYIRDKEKREVDFVIFKEGVLEDLIEVKLSDEKVDRSLQYYASKLKPKKALQIVANLKDPYNLGGLRIDNPFGALNHFKV